MNNIIWISSSAFIISLLIQFIVIRLSFKHNLFIDLHTQDKPQNFHENSTPRSGGIGIILSMLLLLLTPLGWKLVLSIGLAFISGIFEDLYSSLNPKLRLLLQFIAAVSAVFLTNSVITYLGFGMHLPYVIGVIFSIFAIVGLMNAINIIDGFNGLAAGISFLVLLSFSIVALKVDNYEVFQICLIVMSAIFGFLVFNFPKGKIFLGDGGAYLLGFISALIGIFLGASYEIVSPWFVMSILIYPVWEVLFSIMRKMKKGYSPLEPDAYHLHMLIYKHITHSNPLTSVFIISSSLPFMIVSTIFSNNSTANFLVSISFIFCYLILYAYLSKKN